jgi:uncharacterized protein (DUF433 family)
MMSCSKTIMKEQEQTAEYAVLTPDGGWRVAGTRVSLDSVVHAYWEGRQPENIAAEFPTLTLEQVHGAIAFYLKHRALMDSYLAEQAVRWQDLHAASSDRNAELVRRLHDKPSASRVRLPLVPSTRPGSRVLTAENIAELLDEVNDSS